MKKIILKEIANQESKRNVNQGYIQRLREMLDSSEVTEKDFVGTGMITKKDEFLSMFSDNAPRLNRECTDVVLYMGGYYIQMLKGGDYLLKVNGRGSRSSKLSVLESRIYNIISK